MTTTIYGILLRLKSKKQFKDIKIKRNIYKKLKNRIIIFCYADNKLGIISSS